MNRPGSSKFGSFAGTTQPSYQSGRTQSNSPGRSGTHHKIEANDFVPKRFGLKYDPPTIIMEYLIPSSGKLYHHKLKMPQLKANSDTQEMFDALKKKHNQYFAGSKVSDTQIKTLIDKLKTKLPATASKAEEPKAGKFAPLAGQAKGGTFGGSGYTGSGYSGSGYTGSGYTGGGSGYTANKTGSSQAKNEKKADFWAFEEVEDEDQVDYGTANLNKLSKEELQKHKDKMDVLFNKNQKKPGDQGFEYDKQEEFYPDEDNEWDEEI